MEKKEKELRYIVRIAQTDIDGKKSIVEGLRKIKGVSAMFSHAVCTVAGVEKHKQAGYLNDSQISKISEVIEKPATHGIPLWLMNRRKDTEDGKDKHLISSALMFAHDNDLKTLKKIKCYRGVRHYSGLPSRGQRTNANFRRNKGKVTGVKRKAGGKSGRV